MFTALTPFRSQVCERRIGDRYGAVANSLKDKLLRPHGVLAFSGVGLGHLHTVQVDVAIGIGEMFGRELVGLFHIQD